MASDGKRTLGVLVVVGVVLLLVARFVIHNDDKVEEPGASASASTNTSASTSTSTRVRQARYESALVDASIRGLSSGAGTALAVGDGGGIYRHKLDDPKWARMEAPSKATLHAVAQQVDEAIAVGDAGTILELDGDTWKSVASGTTRNLRAVVYT